MINREEGNVTLHDGSESALNWFLNCRDGIVYKREYNDCSGYGSRTTAYFCKDCKAESVSLIVHTYKDDHKVDSDVYEKYLNFDSDSWEEIEKLIKGGGELVRKY